MTEFWIISAPGEKTCQETWDRLNKITSQDNKLSENFKFNMPDLKVGTLDQLVGLSDDLTKLDAFVESSTRKMVSYLADVLEDQKDKVHESLLVRQKPYLQYLTKFQWESAKYPVKQSLRNLSEIISKQVNQIDADLKTRANAYNTLRNNLASMERRAVGSLITRDLSEIVKKEHFVLDSEYLTTLLVVVPKSNFSDWNIKYEKLSDMVVPRSTKLIFEDPDHGLFTVTMFRKVVDEYKLHARESKFIVREFVYDEEILKAGKNEKDKLTMEKSKQFAPLVRWLQINFGELFSAWVHVKALRVFVESVLRYGLPVNFQAALLQPPKKNHKKLREVLNQLYFHLDSGSAGSGNIDMSEDIPGLMALSSQDYYPYVFFKMNADLVGEGGANRQYN